MMIGTIRINLIVAGLAGICTFLLSIGNNLFLTTCLRSIYSFAILFILTFGFRWVLGVFAGSEFFASQSEGQLDTDEAHLGSQLDLATPDDNEATRQMLKDNLEKPGTSDANELPFLPLNPPKLVTNNNLDPEQLAGALRRMSED
jgi:hypothetical protein